MADPQDYSRIIVADPDPSPDLLSRIGRIAVLWEHVDTTLRQGIANLANLSPDMARALLSHMTFPLVCDTILSVFFAVTRDDAKHKELVKLIDNEVKPVYKMRNSFVHSKWGRELHSHVTNDTSSYVLPYKLARNKPDKIDRDVPLTELEDAAKRISQCTYKLNKFLSPYIEPPVPIS